MATATQAAGECDERDKLRKAHRDAIESWTKAGGLDPAREKLPQIAVLEKVVADTLLQIVSHRNSHGC